jgi:PAS domain S-box-containing protein
MKSTSAHARLPAADHHLSARKAAEEALAQAEGTRRLVEEALRQSEESYRILLDGVQDYAIFMMDPRGQVLSWNAGAERIKGYKADEIIGQNFACFFPPEDIDRGRPQEVLRLTASSGRHEEQGLRMRKDGSRFLASVTFTALRDAAGHLRGFSEFSHDLSESKESGARYRGLLEAAPDAMVVVNGAGEIVLLNLQAEKQFGYHRDELVGQAVTNIIPEGFAERLIADDLRSAEDALTQQIGTGIDLTGRRKDGTEFPIEIMLSPLESAEGILVTAAIRNISARKDAEEELKGQARLLDLAHDAIVVRDPDSHIMYWSKGAEATYGWTAEEARGQVTHELLHTVFPVSRAAVDAAIEAAGDWKGELGHTARDGRRLTVESRQSVERDTHGRVRAILEINRDISARKDAEANLLQKVEELNRSNEELGQFAYIASHDLQEPLRMVASYTQLLAKRYQGKLDSDADEFIAFAVDGANRMQRLIEDLLAYSRVGTRGTDLLDTSSEEALQRALINLRGSIEESGALVTHDPLPHVLADETQLVQLFQNLVGNAIKYRSPEVPRVHITAARDGEERWSFAVADNGLGIDPQYFDRIFGMFQRLHKREEYAGTGIGLAICKKIVERHGGSISVESQPGQGSTFRFSLAGGEMKP